MAKIDSKTTTMSQFGTTYDINAINQLAMKMGVKPLTPSQIKSMSADQIQTYLKAGKIAGLNAAKVMRKAGRQFRKNAKLTTSENFKQAQLMHGTIRQAIGEAGTLGAQAIAQNAISRKYNPISAIQQNTDGGTVPNDDKDEEGTKTEKGPVYAYKGRKED